MGCEEACGTCMENRRMLFRDNASAAMLVAPGVCWAVTLKSNRVLAKKYTAADDRGEGREPSAG